MSAHTEGGDWERPLAVERHRANPQVPPHCHRCGMNVWPGDRCYLTIYRYRGAYTCEPCAKQIKAEIAGHHPAEMQP